MVGPCSELTVIRPMPMLGPAALHVNCGIRGQDLRLIVTNNTIASLGVVHLCGSTPRVHPGLRQNWFPYASFCHVALYVQIWHPVRAVQSEQAWCRKDGRGLPSLTE